MLLVWGCCLFVVWVDLVVGLCGCLGCGSLYALCCVLNVTVGFGGLVGGVCVYCLGAWWVGGVLL